MDARSRPCACSSVALIIQHTTRMRPVGLHHIFRKCFLNGTVFGKQYSSSSLSIPIAWQHWVLGPFPKHSSTSSQSGKKSQKIKCVF